MQKTLDLKLKIRGKVNFQSKLFFLPCTPQLAKHTSGSVYHYPQFSDVVSGERLSRELQHSLTRVQGWEAVMRVRVSRSFASFSMYAFARCTQ